jgi:hypothetical protein
MGSPKGPKGPARGEAAGRAAFFIKTIFCRVDVYYTSTRQREIFLTKENISGRSVGIARGSAGESQKE